MSPSEELGTLLLGPYLKAGGSLLVLGTVLLVRLMRLKTCAAGAEEAAQAGLVSRLVPEDMVDAEVGIKLQTDD